LEASTLQPAATLPKPRITVGAPLLRFRSDEQLVALFRAGYEDAFRAIHDRYHKRLFAYARQMLPGRQDAEDALQDVFVRAYAGLRASERDLALRAWLFRVAHNRCVDELRKPSPPPPEVLHLVRPSVHDPFAEVDLRESLRRLVQDIRRLPDQQRSALLMRELAGMPYAELASSLGISVGAVKSLLVRARLALAQAAEARDTACVAIREQLIEAHDHGVRPNANTRKHLRDCSSCKSFRAQLRGVSRQLAGFAPALGPLGFLANLLGLSGGGGAAGGAGGGAAALGGGGTAASAGGLAIGTSHVATLLVAAAATAGGAVGLQRTILAPAHHVAHVRPAARHTERAGAARDAEAKAAFAPGSSSSSAAPGTIAIRPPAPAASRPASIPAPHQRLHHVHKPLTASGGEPVVSTSTATAPTPIATTCAAAPATAVASVTSPASGSTATTTTTTAPAPVEGSASATSTVSSTPASTCASTATPSLAASTSASGAATPPEGGAAASGASAGTDPGTAGSSGGTAGSSTAGSDVTTG
jgi:RNA polymerase sigma factor (sigma-70 family)